jgi:hypothetical protein
MRLFLFATVSRPALSPTRSPMQWIPELFPGGVKRPGHETAYSSPSSSEVKNSWSYASTPSIRLRGVVLG